ncbi:MAG: hypothetical protein JST93_12360 [Acidobacteria bacterium]|nr:hypothetical protein [Acidobacteriota bacterium]
MQISDAEVRRELDRVVSSPGFLRSAKLACFLRYVVEKTLDGEADTLKEYSLGVHVYQRKQDYEPRTDATVRVEATRLRTKLLEFYSTAESSGIRIDLPKGTYVPKFVSLRDEPEEVTESSPSPVPAEPDSAGTSAKGANESRYSLRWIVVASLSAALLSSAATSLWWSAGNTRRVPTVDSQRHFLEGHRIWARTPANAPLQAAIAEFRQAVVADPNFAQAWVDLGAAQDAQADVDRQARPEWLAKARESELRALQLDPSLAQPRRILGSRYLFQDWRFQDAVRELGKAAGLDPADSHGQFLYISALAIAGNLAEAERSADAAVLVSPKSSEASALRAQVHLWWRRYRKAREEARRAVELDPGSGFAHWMAGVAAQLDGDLPAAEAEYQEAIRQHPVEMRSKAALAHLRAQQGRIDEAHRIVKDAMSCCDARQGWHYVWALVHTASGEKALALDALELSIRDREGSAPYAALEPRFDALHGDPRFERLTAEFLKPR